MNTDIAITQETPEVHTLDFNSDTKPIHRKIAKLPKPLRDLINNSLDDGLPARQIIDKLQASSNPPLPYPISEVNISDWRKTGYQRYLAHLDHLDAVQANHEAALEMVTANDTMTLPEAGLQIIASQYFEFLGEFSPAGLKEKLAEDPLKYTRFLNVFARLVREIVHLRKYRHKMLAQASQRDPNRKSTEIDHSPLVATVDRLFRIPRPPTPTPPAPSDCSPLPPSETLPISHSSHPSHSVTPGAAPSASTESPPPTENQNSKFQNPSPSTPDARPSSSLPKNPTIQQSNNPASENCLDCGSPLPPVPPCALRRPEDNCQNCGMRLPDIGLCYQAGFDHCLNCGATQPHLLPGGERPRAYCHKCGERLHNPEPPNL